MAGRVIASAWMVLVVLTGCITAPDTVDAEPEITLFLVSANGAHNGLVQWQIIDDSDWVATQIMHRKAGEAWHLEEWIESTGFQEKPFRSLSSASVYEVQLKIKDSGGWLIYSGIKEMVTDCSGSECWGDG